MEKSFVNFFVSIVMDIVVGSLPPTNRLDKGMFPEAFPAINAMHLFVILHLFSWETFPSVHVIFDFALICCQVVPLCFLGIKLSHLWPKWFLPRQTIQIVIFVIAKNCLNLIVTHVLQFFKNRANNRIVRVQAQYLNVEKSH